MVLTFTDDYMERCEYYTDDKEIADWYDHIGSPIFYSCDRDYLIECFANAILDHLCKPYSANALYWFSYSYIDQTDHATFRAKYVPNYLNNKAILAKLISRISALKFGDSVEMYHVHIECRQSVFL